MAIADEVVVLPTPPLPPTNINYKEGFSNNFDKFLDIYNKNNKFNKMI